MTTSVLWLRRDLRLTDLPALLAALDSTDQVLPLFVLDDALRRPSGAPRLAFLYRCLRELEARTDGALRVIEGAPEQVVPQLAREAGATAVHISSDQAPYGRERDARVAAALPVPLVATGSPYAVTPGVLRKDDGEPFEPWALPGGPPDGYPAPVVDHRAERAEALRRYAAVTPRPRCVRIPEPAPAPES